MSVLDMFAGGGYYTELVASVVGDKGHVLSHANRAYLNFVGEEFEQRHADGRLPNVNVLMAENNELSLKADGIVGIIDHYAEPGSPGESGGTVHRIDPAIVIADMRAAGFVVDASSDLLRNSNDDYSKNVFAPELRGKTDRFILRFRKAD
jgi:predicted methyltransferase